MRKDLIGTPVDILDFDETLTIAEKAMQENRQCIHVALNAAKFVKLQDDPELRQDVHSGDIIGVDGMSIAWAFKILEGVKVPRVAGADLMTALLSLCADKGYRPYILGARQDVLDRAVKNIEERWPTIEIADKHNGYFGAGDEPSIVCHINDSKADCLFLAMPTPMKERFMAAHRNALTVPFIMGVGGTVDILAGHVERAPAWMQNIGMEWFYRLCQEPRKMFLRYATTNGRFMRIILKKRFSGARRK